MAMIMQTRWTDARGETAYAWVDHCAESVPDVVGRGPRHVEYGVHMPGAEEECFIEGWFAVDERERTLLLGLALWALRYDTLSADHDPLLRTVEQCGDGAEDLEGRQWLTAWLRAAWPGFTVGIAKDLSASAAALVGGEPLSAIPVHEDPPHPVVVAGGREASESFRQIADAFAADHYVWGDQDFSPEGIAPLREIARRLGVDDWEPRTIWA